MLARLLGVLALSLVLVGCTNSDVEISQSVEGRDTRDVEIGAEEKLKAQENLQKFKEQELLENFRGTLNQVDTLYYEDSKTYAMKPNDNLFAYELFSTLNGDIDRAGWDEMVETLARVSLKVKDELGEGYTIAMINPLDDDSVFIIVKDGVVIYNAINEQDFNFKNTEGM